MLDFDNFLLQFFKHWDKTNLTNLKKNFESDLAFLSKLVLIQNSLSK